MHQKSAITRDFRLKAETSSLETACTASNSFRSGGGNKSGISAHFTHILAVTISGTMESVHWATTGDQVAKYPMLVVDEYQDLGRALHSMVMGLCFHTGMRLFAVGDGVAAAACLRYFLRFGM